MYSQGQNNIIIKNFYMTNTQSLSVIRWIRFRHFLFSSS